MQQQLSNTRQARPLAVQRRAFSVGRPAQQRCRSSGTTTDQVSAPPHRATHGPRCAPCSRARRRRARQAGLWANLKQSTEAWGKAPPSMKFEISSEVLGDYEALKQVQALKKWGAALEGSLTRRNVFMGELKQVRRGSGERPAASTVASHVAGDLMLRAHALPPVRPPTPSPGGPALPACLQMGIKEPAQIAVPSVRNDAAFLFSVVASTSVVAVVLGQLPGDWGFFSSYLCGGISLAVLAVGSTSPGLLQALIDGFSQVGQPPPTAPPRPARRSPHLRYPRTRTPSCSTIPHCRCLPGVQQRPHPTRTPPPPHQTNTGVPRLP